MKKLTNLLTILMLSSLAFSCKSIILKLSIKKSIYKKIRVIENTNKTIVFFPMMHIGKTSYYESVKKELDSLRKEDFIVFYEGIFYSSGIDSITKDTLARKSRRFLGYHLTESYKDDQNISLPKYLKKNDLVMQTPENTGLKPEDFNVDMAIDSIINSYEKEFGRILLDSCDFNTKLKDKYDCKGTQTLNRNAFLHNYRDNNLVSEIIKNKNPKIAVIYGYNHLDWVSNRLERKGFSIYKISDYKNKYNQLD